MTESARRIAQALDTMTKVHLAGLPCSFNGHISMEGRHVWHVCASVKEKTKQIGISYPVVLRKPIASEIV